MGGSAGAWSAGAGAVPTVAEAWLEAEARLVAEPAKKLATMPATAAKTNTQAHWMWVAVSWKTSITT